MTKVIAITGGIGSGKTTLSNHLKKTGFFVHESDKVVSEIYSHPSKIFIDLIKKLLNLSKIKKIYINFAPSKKNNFNKIINEFIKSRKISFTYNKKFNDIIKIINNCQYVIGNESGPICIAAALRKKIYSIYFPKYTNKSSKTIYDKVKFFNTDIVNPEKIISRIYSDLI